MHDHLTVEAVMLRMEELRNGIRENILQYGQSILGVAGEGGRPPFVYSIGMSRHHLPELLLIGGYGDRFTGMVNHVCDLTRSKGRAFRDGEIAWLGGSYPVRLIDTPGWVRDEYTVQVGQTLGTEDYSVQQIVLSDNRGLFPGDPGCAKPFDSIPVLGRYAAPPSGASARFDRGE